MRLENEKFSNPVVCALKGIKEAVKNEASVKIDLVVAIIVVALGFIFRISMIEWIICILSIGAMLFAEIMNTAVEAVVDLYTREKNTQAGKAKDISAGAVLVLSISVAIIGLIIFVPKVIDLINK